MNCVMTVHAGVMTVHHTCVMTVHARIKTQRCTCRGHAPRPTRVQCCQSCPSWRAAVEWAAAVHKRGVACVLCERVVSVIARQAVT
jgi:hypothetical protein